MRTGLFLILCLFLNHALALDRHSIPKDSSASGFLSLKNLKEEWLPEESLVGGRTADLTWHRVSLLRHVGGVQRFPGMDEYSGSMGGNFQVGRVRYKKHQLGLSVAATLDTRILRPPGNIIVETADFFVDVLMDYRPLPWLAFRMGPGHTSQHLTDDAFELLGYTRSVNYVRDYWQMFAEWQQVKWGTRVYAGGFYNYHLILDSVRPASGMFQWGLETAPFQLGKAIRPYLALDGKIRGEVNGATSMNVQVGLKVQKGNGRALRTGIHYRSGIEDRGQFYRQRNSAWLAGLWFDF